MVEVNYELAVNIALILGGFALLIKGGDILVEGSVGLASLFRISPMLIGMTIVAFGTSLPELAVSGIAAWQHHPGLVLGNVVGSNLANILLILGLTALICPVKTFRNVVRREMPALVLLSVLVVLLAMNFTLYPFASHGLPYEVTRIDGGILILSFGLLMGLMILKSLRERMELRGPKAEVDDETLEKALEFKTQRSRRACGLMVLGGLVGVVVGGKLLVDGAVAIAEELQVSQTLVGLTLVAVGSSLPELATSAIAARKGQPGLVLGNIVGSNMFNILVLGIAAVIFPLSVAGALLPVLAAMVGFTLLLYLFVYTKFTLERWEGAVFLVCYGVYMGYVVLAA